MAVVYWGLMGLFGLVALIWVLTVVTVIARGRDLEFRITADRDPEAPRTGELVSVIIPARNEEGNIGLCLDAVKAQTYQDLEVIVLNDRSEDGTGAEIEARQADDPRIKMIPGEERPEGWMGKVWACHVAQQKAQGEVLLFIDADVRLEPEAVRQALAYLKANELGALSVFGRLIMVTFWEWVVQPVVGGLILQNNDPREVNDPDKVDKVMANGQFIMTTREAYDAVGGHESIKGEILDDVSYSRRCKEERVGFHVVYGRELFGCRMYASLGEIWEGWTKNLFAGLDFRLALTLIICVALLVIHVLPFVGLAVTGGLAAAGLMEPLDPLLLLFAANVVMAYVVYVLGLRLANYSVAYFWSYPLGMLVTVGLFANSARKIATGRGVSWKGRTYTLTSSRQRQ